MPLKHILNLTKHRFSHLTMGTACLLLAACNGDQYNYIIVPPPEPPQNDTNLEVNLSADVNRDGFIDEQDNEQAEATFSGAIVLPNIDDDSMRCKAFETRNEINLPVEEPAFVNCNDAADSQSNGAEDIEDLTLIDLQVKGSIPENAAVSLKLLNSEGAIDTSGKFRLMIWREDHYIDINESPITVSDFRNNTRIAVEATDIVHDTKEWDGRATIQASIQVADKVINDEVPIMVAPLITQHDLGRVEQLFLSPPQEGASGEVSLYDEISKQFVSDMDAAGADIIDETVVLYDADGDIWTQDFFEPAFVARPQGSGSKVIRVALRSANNSLDPVDYIRLLEQFQDMTILEIYEALETISDEEYFALYDEGLALAETLGDEGVVPQFRRAGIALYSQLRGPDTAAVQIKVKYSDNIEETDTYNSTGNFTTVPPLNADFPLGRMVYGSTPSPSFLTLLDSQQVQEAVWVDTSWLSVGHVDEFFTVLPSSSHPRGWILGVADPALAYQALEQALESGGNTLRIRANTPSSEEDYLPDPEIPDPEVPDPEVPDPDPVPEEDNSMLLTDFLEDPVIRRANDLAITKIDEALAILKSALALSDEDIVGIPAIYAEFDFALEPGEEGLFPPELISFLPNAVNGVHLGNQVFVSPKQYSTVLEGVDVLEKAAEEALAPHGITVRWVDNYSYAHVGGGEIHCVSNAYRDVSDVSAWWNPAQ